MGLSKEILFVINPASGNSGTEKFDLKIKEVAKKVPFSWHLYYTTGKRDAEDISKLIDNLKPKHVIVAGGDGTLNLVASQLINHDINMGIYPGGSANGLAYNLGISNDFETELLKMLKATPNAIDVLEIGKENYCLHLSDIGLNARVIRRFEQDGVRGLGGYGKQAVKELFSDRPKFKAEINTPEGQKKVKAEMIVLANAKSFGTGAQINPEGLLNDGRFEIIILKPYPWWSLFDFILKIFTGKIQAFPHVKILSTTQAKINLDKPQVFQIDGEVKDDINSVKVRIIPQALKVLH